MKFPWWVAVFLLVGFGVVGNSGLAGKAGKELGDDHRTYESEYGEPYETEDNEAADLSNLLADQMTPSYGKSAIKVDNVCTRRRVGDHMCPELFILGVQKGGTSSLWVFLVTSTELKIQTGLNLYEEYAMPKEMHFFDKQSFFAEGVDSYAEHFEVRDEESQLSLDATPAYSRYARVPPLMVSTINMERSRFIITVRDPVHRGYSWYTHILQRLIRMPRFDQAYQVFDYKFSLMSKYMPKLINECVQRWMKYPKLVFQHCWHLTDNVRRTGVLVEETGLETIYPWIPSSIFTDGLYGYMMLHWFRFIRPNLFCIIFYEKLVESFADEIQHIGPCLKPFGREILESDAARGLPLVNHIKCKTCKNFERLVDEELSAVGRKLNEELFTRSNDVFRELMRDHFNRTGMADWEKAYTL
ncbi:hypothetical protein NDN08_007122 [Rhodosorus marinus]|uniref:Sulfotransferase domain-containing protein n=1 Tax=Rhodosorus marinus TaxID=101924 RepID=A0AAV8UIB5_9RHOD|nr:hypothetical protein NDN08_007122 [Rhodosorus marinus]